MFDVVPVEVPRVRTAREATAGAITRLKRAMQSRRDAARLAADVERLAVLVLYDRHHTAVTGKASSRFCSNGWTVLECALTGHAITQCFSVHMHHDLMAVSTVECGGALGEKRFSHHRQRIDF